MLSHQPRYGIEGSARHGGLERVRGADDRSRGTPAAKRVCGECHFWNPDDVLPSLGECENEGGPNYRSARIQDDAAGACFRERSFAGLEQLWCSRCRETIPASELSAHAGHGLFVGTARFTVEEMLDLTVAGD